jgi:predicted ATPase
MTSTSPPPPSSLRRTAELDTVRDVLLLEGEVHLKVAPIPRHEGPLAVRGAIEARLSRSISGEELMAEREASLELARIHFERGLDLDRAV